MNLHDKSQDVRLSVLDIAYKKKISHLGGTFSCVDLLVALYYGDVLNLSGEDRDRMILSKGHACLALYAILVDLGLMQQETLDTYGCNGGLGAQLDINTPGIDWNTGSLGHSVGVCSGMALSAQIDQSDMHAYTIVGDAECYEGSIWEAMAFAGHRQLSNLTVLIDRNRLSVTEPLDDDSFFGNMPLLAGGFGWDCKTINGHSFAEIIDVMKDSKLSDRPTLVIANTIKGKGISFMENQAHWHHGAPSDEEYQQAKKEIAGG